MLLAVASCSLPYGWDEAKPGTLVIGRIERQLAALPCIGTLDRWERHFSFPYAYLEAATGTRVDRNAIFFEFVEASRPPYRPRRVLQGADLDEVAPRTAWGEYHIASDSLFLLTCGDGPLSRSRIDAFIRWRETP